MYCNQVTSKSKKNRETKRRSPQRYLERLPDLPFKGYESEDPSGMCSRQRSIGVIEASRCQFELEVGIMILCYPIYLFYYVLYVYNSQLKVNICKYKLITHTHIPQFFFLWGTSDKPYATICAISPDILQHPCERDFWHQKFTHPIHRTPVRQSPVRQL